MAKYSYEFKLQVVQAYLDGEGGKYLSTLSNIINHLLPLALQLQPIHSFYNQYSIDA